MKQVVFLATSLIFVTLASAPAWAGATPFLITNRTSSLDPSVPAEAALLAALNTAADNVQDTINNGILSQTGRANFADGLARANTSSTSSLILDRASNPDRISVGLGLQAGFYAPGGFSTSSISAANGLPALGIGAQAAVYAMVPARLIGLSKLGPINGDRMMVSFSGMVFSTTVSGVSLDFLNLGVNAQYKLVQGVGFPFLASWGGINLGTGLNYASSSVSYSASLSESSTVPVSPDTATMSVNMNYNLGVRSSTFTIPLELSTNVTALYFFTLYGGFGFDINMGSSALTGTASGPVVATTTSRVLSPSNLFSGTATLNLNDGTSGSPAFLTARGFGGLQFNVSVLKIGVEYSMLSNGTQGGALMARAAF